jgi:hypothetical protein
MLTRLISYGHLPFYAIQQLDMTANWVWLEVDPRIYSTTMTLVDSAANNTLILSPVFHALDKAVRTTMLAKGYAWGSFKDKIWNVLPTVEMKIWNVFHGVTNGECVLYFYVSSDDDICLTSRPDDAKSSNFREQSNEII